MNDKKSKWTEKEAEDNIVLKHMDIRKPVLCEIAILEQSPKPVE